MKLTEVSLDSLGKIFTTVAAGVILAWFLSGPRSTVAVKIDWISVASINRIGLKDMEKFVELAKVPPNPNGKEVSGLGDFTLAEITIENPSRYTANKVELKIPTADFILNSDGILHIANNDGMLNVGQMHPGDRQRIYAVLPTSVFGYEIEQIRGTSDGIALAVTKNKMIDGAIPFSATIVAWLNNYFIAQYVAVALVFVGLPLLFASILMYVYAKYNQKFRVGLMKPWYRHQTLADADYIRKHHPLDDLVYQNEKAKAESASANPQTPPASSPAETVRQR